MCYVVFDVVDKTKGMIKIIQSGGNYYLNLQGNKDETQSKVVDWTFIPLLC